MERIKRLLNISPQETHVEILDKILNETAEKFIIALGGKDNINDIDYCITRLRLILSDLKKVKLKELNKLGSKGNIEVDHNGLQIILGKQAYYIAEAMKNILK